MNRKGQVFLLLTLLILSFLVGVSNVLFDVQKSEFLEPSPDSEEMLEVWENTVSAIEQIITIQMAINTQNGNPSGIPGDYDLEIQTELSKLEIYLNDRGIASSLSLDVSVPTLYDITNLVTSYNVTFSAVILVHLESLSGYSINQILNINISYLAIGQPNLLTVFKTINGKVSYISNCSISVSAGTIIDNGNGSYTASSSPVTFTITTPNQILLDVAA